MIQKKSALQLSVIKKSLADLKIFKEAILSAALGSNKNIEFKRKFAEGKRLCEFGLKEFPEDPDFIFFEALFAHRMANRDLAAHSIEKAILLVDGHAAFSPKTTLPNLKGAREAFSILNEYNLIKIFPVGDIQVYYTDDLVGGGDRFGQEYVNIIYDKFGCSGRTFDRAVEWCVGPGFIGFSLLANGLCKSLCLADIHPKSVRAADFSVSLNRLGDRVKVYQSDCLQGIPEEQETWDLIVGNPPHFPDPSEDKGHTGDLTARTRIDEGWELHKRFYRDVGKFLSNDGVIMMCENAATSTPETFAEMINKNNLKIVDVFKFPSNQGFFCMRVEKLGR